MSSRRLPISMALCPLTPTRRKMARSSASLNEPAPSLASFSLGRSSWGRSLMLLM